jgi:oligoribonuclease (3'-5' exoribonuclease)
MSSQYLVFCDIETSGLDFYQHVPLEIALCVYDMSQNNRVSVYQSLISCNEEEYKKGDPQAFQVNGLNWEVIQTGKSPFAVKEDILQLFKENKICLVLIECSFPKSSMLKLKPN